MHRYAPTPRQMLWGVLGAFALMVLFVGVGYAVTSIPSPNALAVQQTTQLYYSDGHTLLARLPGVNRTNVQLSQVPPPVQKAVLSAEDRSFDSEPGISPTGILRALIVDLKGGDVQQGGSTITQQYVKNAYLSQQRTFTRKFKEIFIAVKLGNTRPKNEILQDYLNTIYFGRNAYGIQAAAHAYFGVDVSKLDVAEGAVLAAVIRAPGVYDPAIDKAAAVKRWHYVLDGMVKKHWLPADEAAQVQYPDKQLKSATQLQRVSPGDCVKQTFFICRAVEAYLNQNGFDEARLESGGYKVVTTIDKTAQRGAVAAIDANNGGYRTSGPDRGREAALVTVAPGDGAIRAMYGGNDGCAHHTRPDDCTDLTGVTALFGGGGDYTRSPGSSFKPYTLIAALQQGIGLDSRFDGPPHIDFAGTNGKGIDNAGHESCMNCTLTEALAKSINTIFVPLADKVGPDSVAKVAHDAGVQSRHQLDPVPTITLGSSDVAPIDQAMGYATIAAQGIYAKPYLVASVRTSSGHVVYRAKKDTRRALPADVMADTTYAMTKVLDCSSGGTACGKSLPGRPAAGKTGTNGQGHDNFDAWFIGFTPQLSTAVWYGNTDRHKPVTSGGVPIFGADLPASTWQQMMTTALAGKQVLSFPPPAHVGSSQDNSTASPSPSATKSSKSPSPTPTVTVTTPSLSPSGPGPSKSPSPTGSSSSSPAPAATSSPTKGHGPGG